MMLPIGLSYIAFIMLKYIPSIPSFIKAFTMKGCWILSVFASVNMLFYIEWLAYFKITLHPWDEADFIMADDLFDMLLNLVCQYFIEDFCMYVH
jgi:hypothetical protein